MFDLAYLFFRGASGFALIVVGLGFLFTLAGTRATRSLGVLFSSVGTLFCISALDSVWPLPSAIDSFVILALVYSVSQALFELALYLLGDARVEKHRRRVYLVGAALSLLVWSLPLFDSALGWATSSVSVEDSHAQGPLQTILGPIIYGWPLAVTALSIQLGRWRLRDLSLTLPDLRVVFWGLIVLLALLAVSLLALAVASEGLYRAGQTALQLLMLAWYFHLNRFPDRFGQIREGVAQRHQNNVSQDAAQWGILAERLERVVEDATLLCLPRLSVADLATKVGLPAYLLSRYFNHQLGLPFPTWLNQQRIAWVCRRMAQDPEAKLLDLAFEAGYNSKSTFNLQFSRIMGMSPTDYRTSHRAEFAKQDDNPTPK